MKPLIFATLCSWLLVVVGCQRHPDEGKPRRSRAFLEQQDALANELGKGKPAAVATRDQAQAKLKAMEEQALLDKQAEEAAAADKFARTLRDAEAFNRKP